MIKYIVLACFMICVTACNKKVESNTSKVIAEPPLVVEKTDKEKKEEEFEQFKLSIIRSHSPDEAINGCSILFSDERFEHENLGRACFLWWARTNLTFEHVNVKKNETTYGLIMKNSAPQIGKRLCAVGSIIQIEESGNTGNTVSYGLISSGTNLIHFTNAGSSGNLVEGKIARMCGYTIGQYHYNNSGGGSSHAIDLVGMWDLNWKMPTYIYE